VPNIALLPRVCVRVRRSPDINREGVLQRDSQVRVFFKSVTAD
jgi:hypothetical protein